MKLTTKGRFAVSAILDIALNQKNGPVTLLAVSERQGISLSYLEQLFSKLRKGEIVSSIRGPGGGYRIKKAYTDITVRQIISAVDEKKCLLIGAGEMTQLALKYLKSNNVHEITICNRKEEKGK